LRQTYLELIAGLLLFLPDLARANLADMGSHVGREMANSRRGTDLETEAARQSHTIDWSRIMGMPDPCRSNVGYQRIVAIYIKYLQSGVNYYNKNNLRSATLCGYTTTINTLFELQNYRLPIMAGVIINNVIKEENIAKQQAPLDNAIFAEIQQSALDSNIPNLDRSLFADIVALGQYIVHRVSKYTQKTQLKVNHHVYPSRHQVIKALIAKDVA
jgi:hypothetical protein